VKRPQQRRPLAMHLCPSFILQTPPPNTPADNASTTTITMARKVYTGHFDRLAIFPNRLFSCLLLLERACLQIVMRLRHFVSGFSSIARVNAAIASFHPPQSESAPPIIFPPSACVGLYCDTRRNCASASRIFPTGRYHANAPHLNHSGPAPPP